MTRSWNSVRGGSEQCLKNINMIIMGQYGNEGDINDVQSHVKKFEVYLQGNSLNNSKKESRITRFLQRLLA